MEVLYKKMNDTIQVLGGMKTEMKKKKHRIV